MTARTVLNTDTLETFRTTFNSLSTTDIGDLANLTTTDKSSVVAAINESSLASFSFTLSDYTSTEQTISSGDNLNIVGSSGITATVSATDTLTISLDSTITGLTSITSTTITDGTLSINSGSITGTVNITGTGTLNMTTDVQVNGASLSSQAFAIAQAIALG